jgi:hypothetical protein
VKIEKNGARTLLRLGLPALGVVAACTAAEGPDYQGTAQSASSGSASGEAGGAGGGGGDGGGSTGASGGRGGGGGGAPDPSAGGSVDRGAVTVGVGGTGGDDDDDDDDSSS